MPKQNRHPSQTINRHNSQKSRAESSTSNSSVRNNLIDKAKTIIETANAKIIKLNTQYATVKAENEELEQQLIDLRQEQKEKEEIGAEYKDKLVAQSETIQKWKQKIDELSQEIIAIHAQRREDEQSYKENLLSITDTLDKVHGDTVGKLKYGRISQKVVIFTEKINHLFYYDENGPKFFVVKDVSVNNHQIQSNMKRPWFLLIGKKRSVLFAAPSIEIRDKWVDFISASLEALKAEESNTSLIRWNANSVNQPLSPLFDQYESDRDENDLSVVTNSSTKTNHGHFNGHQRVHSYSLQNQRTRNMMRAKQMKHARTQSMTQKSRSTSFDHHPVHVTVCYNIKEDKIEQFLSALKPMIIATNKEPGCIRFNIHQDKGEKSKFIMMEEWKNQKYLTMHLKSEHLKKYRERTRNHNVHKSIPEVFFCSELVVV